VAIAGGSVEPLAPGEDVGILAAVALRGGDELRGAVVVDLVVPLHEGPYPGAGVVEVREG
jgi:hypothetical protein